MFLVFLHVLVSPIFDFSFLKSIDFIYYDNALFVYDIN
jgi:hypothetical protein